MNVLIVDNHALARRGLALVVEGAIDGAQAIEAATLDAAREVLDGEPADIVLIDVQLSDGTDRPDAPGGITLLKETRAAWPTTPVIMLTSYDTGSHAREALAAGAAGYLLTDSTPSDLAQAMKVAIAGGSNIMSTRVISRLFDEAPRTQADPAKLEGAAEEAHITVRETQILELVIGGESNRQIAEKLGLSDKTVKSHLATLYRKMDVANRTQAAMVALARGIVAQPAMSPQRSGVATSDGVE